MLNFVNYKAKILVVDDDEEWQTIFKQVFTSNDYLVEVARSYVEAEDFLANMSFDLAIVDISLDEQDSTNTDRMKLLDEIRNTAKRTKVLMVAATESFQFAKAAFHKYSDLDLIAKTDLALGQIVRIIERTMQELYTAKEPINILRRGASVWNPWRDKNPAIMINLSGANLERTQLGGLELSGINLSKAHLSSSSLMYANLKAVNLNKSILMHADLTGADLTGADLRGAILNNARLSGAILSAAILSGASLSDAFLGGTNFSNADLSNADLQNTNLMMSNLSGANLRGAILFNADLTNADLSGADLTGADLTRAILMGTKIDKAKISTASVYGVNVWDLTGEFEEQKDLVITPKSAPVITVDNIKVAQFIYLILNNKEIRDVLNTLTSKAVLILGRFADDKRKATLDALRNKLREYNLLPIVFDFDRPVDRNITETVKTLAGISYFVIADVTSPKSSPLELQAIVPDYQIPIVPIIHEGELPFSMINDLRTQHSGLLDPLTYDTEEMLINALKSAIIDPAIEKHNELRLIKAQKPKIRSAKDFLDKEME